VNYFLAGALAGVSSLTVSDFFLAAGLAFFFSKSSRVTLNNLEGDIALNAFVLN
jgi:hypothetical protein